MKYYLVVMFLINGVWIPGDLYQPDGWSSIEYDSLDSCEIRAGFTNRYISMTPLNNHMKAECWPNHPRLNKYLNVVL